jgi:hypothetical protein
MAKTAVINPRRRRRRAKKTTHRRRRRNYGAAATVARTANRRRRRTSHHRRRRNPSVPSVYSSGGYRRSNPISFNLDHLVEITPAATAGVWAARWGVKMAGPMDNGEPGIKHALAVWLASSLGGQLLGSAFGSEAKGAYATIAALGFGGDLFARKRFFKDTKWVQENIYLEGVDDMEEVDDTPNYSEGADLNGFQQHSALGAVDTFTDAAGNNYVRTEQGWALAGLGETFVDSDGNVFELQGGMGTQQFQYPPNYAQLIDGVGASYMGNVPSDPAYGPSGSAVAGFQQHSALGLARARPGSSSFGYAR